MRVLILGANGFIGSAVVSALMQNDMGVRAVVRDPRKFERRFSGTEAVKADLQDKASREPAFWIQALAGVDAVVNAAGVLQSRREGVAWAVHLHAPNALYDACERSGVRRIIQISAVGIEESETVFARSKRAGDQALMARDLDWTILRPAVVIGEGAYGGTAMVRAIAAVPWITPVIDAVGKSEPEMDFIHKADLAASIVHLLQRDAAKKTVLEPASQERMTLRAAVAAYRGWLGLAPRTFMAVPNWAAKALARVGDFTRLGPISSTALAQFNARLTGDASAFEAASGVQARGLTAMLNARPAETQDLWHARLYLIRPLIRLALAVMWLVSGLLGLVVDPQRYLTVFAPFTSDMETEAALGKFMGAVDLAIALALIVGWRLKLLASIQLAMVVGYTIALSLLLPSLWADLFGGLLKNLPIIALIAVHRILEEER
jgi:nucleoside-diphosphate-sugar epimerase